MKYNHYMPWNRILFGFVYDIEFGFVYDIV